MLFGMLIGIKLVMVIIEKIRMFKMGIIIKLFKFDCIFDVLIKLFELKVICNNVVFKSKMY